MMAQECFFIGKGAPLYSCRDNRGEDSAVLYESVPTPLFGANVFVV